MNTNGRLLLALTTKQPPMSSTDHGGGEAAGGQAQQSDTAKLKADAQNVVSIIKGDKAKAHEDLVPENRRVSETAWPKNLALAKALENMGPTSREVREIAPIIESLDKSCED